MRPYLAILVDSFREAIHSRVLVVVLVLITLLFLVLLPVTLEDQVTTGLKDGDVLNLTQLALPILAAGKSEDPTPSPAKHVWDRLDAKQREGLAQLIARGSAVDSREDFMAIAMAAGQLIESLDKQISDPAWYEEAAFEQVRLAREGRQLLERKSKGETLSREESQRLNRLALEAAFPESIAVSPAKTLAVGYAFSDKQSLPITREQLRDQLPAGMVTFIDWAFGILGILTSLLVTASIIPQLFEPGSLHLLLSKPISRSLLYVTKFAGGCAFALLSVAYFACGLWLLLGLRLDVWDYRLLAAIPVYTFVFAIYYSVTALAGVLYRNTIVAVVCGVLFWAFCFGLGTVKFWTTFLVEQPTRINRLTSAGESILATRSDGVQIWNAEERRWDRVFRSQQDGNDFMMTSLPEFGPFYDAEHDQLISQQGRFRSSEPMVSVAPRSVLWPRTAGALLPSGAIALMLDRQSRVVVITLDGIYRSTGNVAKADDAPKVLGFSLPFGGSSSFEKVSSGEWNFRAQPVAAAIDLASGAIAIYSRGRIGVWQTTSSEGKYTEQVSRTLEEEEKTEMQIVVGSKTILLAADDGRLWALDRDTLATRGEYRPEGKNGVRQMRASPDGERIAVVFEHGKLWLFDQATQQLATAGIAGQGSVSAIEFEPSGKLLVAHNVHLVSRVDLAAGTSTLVCRPQLNSWEMAHYYAIMPLYNLFPKPGEVQRTLVYFVTGEETVDNDEAGQLPRDAVAVTRLNPWQPIWSGALFIAVLLAIGCFYMERMEF